MWFFPFALLLTGCGQAGERDMQTCLSDAQRMQKTRSIADAGALDDYAKACMEANGYRLNAVHSGCGRGDPFLDANCYARR
jgi:hypothetical protein